MMICPKCESENSEGSVFCNTCGVRFMVSSSDTNYGGYPSVYETPYFEAEGYGMRVSISESRFNMHLAAGVVISLLFGTMFIVLGLTRSVEPLIYMGLIYWILAALVIPMNMAFVHRYRKKGRPLDYGGNPTQPTAEEVMRVEDDIEDERRGKRPTDDAQLGDDFMMRRI